MTINFIQKRSASVYNVFFSSPLQSGRWLDRYCWGPRQPLRAAQVLHHFTSSFFTFTFHSDFSLSLSSNISPLSLFIQIFTFLKYLNANLSEQLKYSITLCPLFPLFFIFTFTFHSDFSLSSNISSLSLFILIFTFLKYLNANLSEQLKYFITPLSHLFLYF